MKKMTPIIALITALFVTSCMNEQKVADLLKEKPEIIFDAIKAEPAKFMETIQEVANAAKGEMEKKRVEAEKQAFEESFKNPLEPKIRDDESFRGPKDAPLVIVEYSDFECPFCSRGYNTVNQLMKKYEGKIKFVYKHLPLSFHPQAMISAQYFEAIRLQSADKAFAFHDEIFDNQKQLRLGKKFLDKIAKKVGANMSKLKKDIDSDKVKDRIKEDMAEAAKFGIQGTPGFVFNGIPVKGAYPVSHFDTIIEELKKRNLVKL